MKIIIILITITISTSAFARSNGHKGQAHDSTGHHISGPVSQPTNISKPSQSQSNTQYNNSSEATKLLLEKHHDGVPETPAIKPESQKYHDDFMSKFNRSKYTEKPDKTEPPKIITIKTHNQEPPPPSGTIKRDEHGRIERSEHAKNDFKKQKPCPSNGKTSGSCPGYVIDHIKPLYKGGSDHPSNMQWQTITEGKAKDKWE